MSSWSKTLVALDCSTGVLFPNEAKFDTLNLEDLLWIDECVGAARGPKGIQTDRQTG